MIHRPIQNIPWYWYCFLVPFLPFGWIPVNIWFCTHKIHQHLSNCMSTRHSNALLMPTWIRASFIESWQTGAAVSRLIGIRSYSNNKFILYLYAQPKTWRFTKWINQVRWLKRPKEYKEIEHPFAALQIFPAELSSSGTKAVRTLGPGLVPWSSLWEAGPDQKIDVWCYPRTAVMEAVGK